MTAGEVSNRRRECGGVLKRSLRSRLVSVFAGVVCVRTSHLLITKAMQKACALPTLANYGSSTSRVGLETLVFSKFGSEVSH